MIWDIDLTDPLFPAEFARVFAPVTRLPLYFCCRCPSPTLYRVESNAKVKVFRPSYVTTSEENPFVNSPREFERRPIEFEQIPDAIDALISLADDIGFADLDSRSHRRLSRFLGARASSKLPFSQLGGAPLFYQGHEENACPNPHCPASAVDHPYSFADRWMLMKEFAVIGEHDAKLRDASGYYQTAFHICWICHSLHGKYRST